MLTLVVGTAAVLGVTLVGALVVILVFAVQIGAFMAETSVALDVANEGASRLVRRVERMQGAIEAAASELAPAET